MYLIVRKAGKKSALLFMKPNAVVSSNDSDILYTVGDRLELY